ncbi:predicted aminopeptidase [Hahella chejuensis KCTC 2396]|uniref:Predicted aminopeptidase n=1 Tax=Hahella chejuensis (strain KCTC 2396) TaxID=349521 RepID=Q2SKL1_HAHCH|nr:M20/M25/M40 family metallo-hydrolase [Hahella chejuensis]ABC28813.1 predicted aminopeptidase [Hahella chejuensis KCTC 2396]
MFPEISTKKLLPGLACLMLATGCSNNNDSNDGGSNANKSADDYLVDLAHPTKGIGARVAGTESERKAEAYLLAELKSLGYAPSAQAFTYKDRDNNEFNSSNVIFEKAGSNADKVLVLGAHYDTAGEDLGSTGATDNGTGVSTLLDVAKRIKDKTLPYTLRFVFFGAEEKGLHGSNYYVSQLSVDDLSKIVGMVNYDTVAGGDYLYVHSADSATPYECSGDNSSYAAGDTVRKGMLNASIALDGDNDFLIHPSVDGGYQAGETGDWSDHVAFACRGIPIAYVEATNFDIDGKYGKDGYSQTVNPQFWTCFDEATVGACDKDAEVKWGEIWHTGSDRIDAMESAFPGRVSSQMEQAVKATVEFVSFADYYLP